MSGGELEYLYSKIRTCLELNYKPSTPERKAFLNHMKLVVEALHDIEWVDSCDMGQGDENEAILRCLQDNDSLATLIEEKEK